MPGPQPYGKRLPAGAYRMRPYVEIDIPHIKLHCIYWSYRTCVYRICSDIFQWSIQRSAFMIFNLLCAPCFAAMGAIKREMNNGKWTAIAIGYMCLLAYCASLVVYQIGGLIAGEVSFNIFTVVAIAIVVLTIYLLFRPNKYEGVNEVKFDEKKAVASK